MNKLGKYMQKLINYAINLMEKENSGSLDMPSKNIILDPLKNTHLNPKSNILLDPIKNPRINPKENPKTWKQCQIEVFRETLIWNYLTKKQKFMCMQYVKNMKV